MSVKTIDIHGFTPDQAKRIVEFEVQRAVSGSKLLIIHGSNRGTALRDMVRSLSSPRIKEIMPCFANDGETTIYLN
ncbi:MAG: Smr/MutS family protein [Oscillospiraceae bacterium]|nr:Smr/MutS family protein [Oscillospiraceae bacterium]